MMGGIAIQLTIMHSQGSHQRWRAVAALARPALSKPYNCLMMRAERWTFAAAAAGVCASLFFGTRTSASLGHPRLMGASATADLVITVPVAAPRPSAAFVAAATNCRYFASGHALVRHSRGTMDRRANRKPHTNLRARRGCRESDSRGGRSLASFGTAGAGLGRRDCRPLLRAIFLAGEARRASGMARV